VTASVEGTSSVATVVDVHAHVTVPEMLAGAGAHGRFRPHVHLKDGHQVGVQLGGRGIDSIVDELSRIDVVLSESRERGVERIVASPWVATLPHAMDLGAATELCRAHNAGMAAAVARDPGRVDGLGAVPLQDGLRAAEVLAEAVASGLVGVEITPSVDGRWLGDASLEPFWEAAEELRAIVFVHPSTRGLGMDVFDEYYLWNSVANPTETAIAAAHLLMSGVLERHRHLAIVLAHGGGVLPAVAGRLDQAWRVRPEARAHLVSSPLDSFRRLRFDSVTHDASALLALVRAVGAGNVLLGSDRPFDMGRAEPVADVRALGLDLDEEASILGGNALELIAGVRGGAAASGGRGRRDGVGL
jgi:aminocarboxymuconate-semialdehyde decarboxylase